MRLVVSNCTACESRGVPCVSDSSNSVALCKGCDFRGTFLKLSTYKSAK